MSEETSQTGGEFERQPVPERAWPGFKNFIGMYTGEHCAGTELMIGPLFVAAGVSAFDVVVGLIVGNALAVLGVGTLISVVAAYGYHLVAWVANIAAPWMVLVFLAFGVVALRQFIDFTGASVHSASDLWRLADEVIWRGGQPLPRIVFVSDGILGPRHENPGHRRHGTNHWREGPQTLPHGNPCIDGGVEPWHNRAGLSCGRPRGRSTRHLVVSCLAPSGCWASVDSDPSKGIEA